MIQIKVPSGNEAKLTTGRTGFAAVPRLTATTTKITNRVKSGSI